MTARPTPATHPYAAIYWNYGDGAAGMFAETWVREDPFDAHRTYRPIDDVLAYLWDRAERGLTVNVIDHH